MGLTNRLSFEFLHVSNGGPGTVANPAIVQSDFRFA
jgi:hypothetical protein